MNGKSLLVFGRNSKGNEKHAIGNGRKGGPCHMEAENLPEEMTESFPHLEKETNIQVKESWRVPSKINLKILAPTHLIMKVSKSRDKEKIIKAVREKQLITWKETPIKPCTAISAEIL